MQGDTRQLAIAAVLGLALLGLLVRACVALNPYSGANTPPKFGDFECQRHWMEITYHTPIALWYTNTSDNDLSWWGLDYPPLTAYWSLAWGAIAHRINPAWVALHESRGLETPGVKLYMRSTVLVADALIYFPAALFFIHRFYSSEHLSQKLSAFALMVVQPALIMIDHGHFQYNSVSLGLTMLGAAFLLRSDETNFVWGAIAFTLALNYKQMSLYYALPFFFFILGSALRDKTWGTCVRRVAVVGVAVIATTAVLWWPWRTADAGLQLLGRVFPVGRGLYEDKVGNVWCSMSPLIKLKDLYSTAFLTRMCAAVTLAAALPKCLYCLRHPRPLVFVETLFNTSLAFYLFSYHVHEKSALLPGLVASMLAVQYPTLSFVFNLYAGFSMYPLLKREGLGLAYAGTMGLFCLVSWSAVRRDIAAMPRPRLAAVLLGGSLAGMVALHAADALITPPPRLPDLWTLLITSYSCAHFILLYLLSALPTRTPPPAAKAKRH